MKDNSQLKEFIDLVINPHKFINDLSILNLQYTKLNNKFYSSCDDRNYYKICVPKTIDDELNIRTMAHEVGHIYFRHLQLFKMLDETIITALSSDFTSISNYLTNVCQIQNADKLLKALIEDSSVNHFIHNIAMDLEVNSKILSKEDLNFMKEHFEEVNKNLGISQDNNNDYKYIHPLDFYDSNGNPWPVGLSYAEYLQMILSRLDQFIKLVKTKSGKDDVIEAIHDSVSSNTDSDHMSNSRLDADQVRKSKYDQASSNEGGNRGNLRNVLHEKADVHADEVDMCLIEITRSIKKQIINKTIKRDSLYYYNRGILKDTLVGKYVSRTSLTNSAKLVFLIDVSGSMPNNLINRILSTISGKLFKINRELRYDLILWNTRLVNHLTNLKPGKPVPDIYRGGGTTIARGIKFFKDNYKDETLVIISDFEDSLNEWKDELITMPKSTQVWGINYGRTEINTNRFNPSPIKIRNIKYYK